MDVSVIVLSYNTKDITLQCLRSVLNNTWGIDYEIVVIDNNSRDGSVEAVSELAREQKQVRLIKNKRNKGFAAGNNQGVKASRGRSLLFLNSDTIVEDNVINDIYSWMNDQPKVGIATCMLKNPDGSIQGTGGYFPNLIRVFSWMTIQDLPLVDHFIKPFHPMRDKSFKKGTSFYKSAKEIDWATGAFMMVKREVHEQIGGWDEEFFMYSEDLDYCYRARDAGWKVFYLPKISITHIGGASSTKEYPILSEYEGIKRFYKKHYPMWQMPLLRVLLKVGALGRIFLFWITEGKDSAKIYAKAFSKA